MPRTLFLVVLSGAISVALGGRGFADQSIAPQPGSSSRAKIALSTPTLPLVFEQNTGQAPPQIKFLSHGNHSLLLITSKGATLLFDGPGHPTERVSSKSSAPSAAMELRLVDANPEAGVQGDQKIAARINYFSGRDPSHWHTNVPAFAAVSVHDAWPGVDVEYSRDPARPSGAVECTFTVRPGSDSSAIKLAFAGFDRIRKVPGGGLEFQAGSRAVELANLHVFEEDRDGRHEVKASLIVKSAPNQGMAGAQVWFQVSRRDPRARLIIDPTLVYSTFIGGGGEPGVVGSYAYGTGDSANAIALDAAGNEYLTGSTTSYGFPTTNHGFSNSCPYDVMAPCFPTFVTKINGQTGAVIYSTFFGGGSASVGWDQGRGIAVDGTGEAYVTGVTFSSNFPTTAGAYKTRCSICTPNGFLVKLSADGGTLLYSTLLSDTAEPVPSGVAIDSSGSAYIAGTLGVSSFIMVFDPTGSTLTYSLQLPSSYGNAIAVSPNHLIFIGGQAINSYFPTTPNAYQPDCRDCYSRNRGFVSVINPAAGSTLASLIYSTTLGGSVHGDFISSVILDSAGRVWAAGAAGAGRFHAGVAYGIKSCAGISCGTRAIAALIDPSKSGRSSLAYSASIAGNGADVAYAIGLDSSGSVYVGGQTTSTNFPVSRNALQKAYSTCRRCAPYRAAGFVTAFRPLTHRLIYSTYLGGPKKPPATDQQGKYLLERDAVHAITVDPSGIIHATGVTYDDAFPVTANAAQPVCKACSQLASNAFITRINPIAATPVLGLQYSSYLGGSGTRYYGDAARSVATDSSGMIYVGGITASPDFPSTPGALQTSCPQCVGWTRQGHVFPRYDGFVAKLNYAAPPGAQLVYATYLGGPTLPNPDDLAVSSAVNGIAVDSTGEAYLVGRTSDPDFPVTAGAYQSSCPGYCGPTFFSKLDASGSKLLYSTYLGGSLIDTPVGVAVNSQGDAFIAGYTASKDFPTTVGAFQTTCAPCYASTIQSLGSFVSEIDPTANGSASLVYSTYLSGSGHADGSGSISGDAISAMTADSAGNVIVTGQATSYDFPVTSGAYQTARLAAGWLPAFITVLDPKASGSAQLVYSTYLGANKGNVSPSAVQVNGDGDIFVGGNTMADDFPVTANSFQPFCARSLLCNNGFVAELSPAARTSNQLAYGTFLGGSTTSGSEAITGIGLDATGKIYLTGRTKSSDFPVTSDAFQPTSPTSVFNGGSSAFLTVLDPTHSGSTELVYSTYLGGSATDTATGIAVGPLGLVALSGWTYSSDFPITANAFEPNCPACRNPDVDTYLNGDGFVAAFQF